MQENDKFTNIEFNDIFQDEFYTSVLQKPYIAAFNFTFNRTFSLKKFLK